MSPRHDPDLLDVLDEFFNEYYDSAIRALATEHPAKTTLNVDYNDIVAYDADLADDWANQPRELLRYGEAAVQEYDLPVDVELEQVQITLTNVPYSTSPRELSTEHANSLVSVEGVVVDVEEPVTRVSEAAFECQLCGTLTRVPQKSFDDELDEPHRCQGCERDEKYEVHQGQSEFEEYQWARIADFPVGFREGESPISVDVHLRGSLAGELWDGMGVAVTGIATLQQVEEKVFEILIDARGVSEADGVDVEEWRDEYLGVSTNAEFEESSSARLSDFVERSRQVIQQGGNLDEDNTKAKIVTPFVHALGWNVFDSSEVELEYPRQDDDFDDRVDYALFESDDHPRVLVEAKQVNVGLDGFTSQIKRYLRLFGGKYGVLTNGERYLVYQRVEGDAPDETLMADCTLEELEIREGIVSALSPLESLGE